MIFLSKRRKCVKSVLKNMFLTHFTYCFLLFNVLILYVVLYAEEGALKTHRK